jgi:hypothetical protein
MSKQTAVEWLIDELHRRLSIIKSEPNGDVRETMIDNFLIDFEQAKQKEKEQMLEVSKAACFSTGEFEQYYNKTYTNEK